MKMPSMENWTYDMWVAYMTETKALNKAACEAVSVDRDKYKDADRDKHEMLIDAYRKRDAIKAENDNLRKALEFYGDSCDATETTPCGYEGNLCCMTARNALGKEGVTS